MGGQQLLEELRARNLKKILAVYVSSAITLVGVVRLFSEAYNLPKFIFPVSVTILTCGLASAILYAWYHGRPGPQRVTGRELAMHGIIVLVAVLAVARVVQTGSRTPVRPLPEKSIAVLPFSNLSGSQEEDYFSDGMTEDIITHLSKIKDLRVVSRTSVLKYRGTDLAIPKIGEELGVGAILEGSVRKSGSRIRIVGQLINASTDEHLWAETYDREMTDIFAIQTDVARRIAAALEATLTPAELERIEHRATENLEAYSFYLRGRDHYNRYIESENEQAIALFQKAVQVDPSFALGYAGLGDAYCQRVKRFAWPETWSDSAIAVSTRSLELDPNLAEGRKALGLAYECRGRLTEALAEYMKAVALNPGYAPVVANIAWVHSSLGDYDQALQWMKKSVLLNPGAAHRYMYVADLYSGLADDTSAIHWYRRALALEPALAAAHVELAYQFIILGLQDSAWVHIRIALASEADNVRTLEAAGTLLLMQDSLPRARATLQQAVDLSSLTQGPGVQLSLALARLGRHREAQRILDTLAAGYRAAIDGGDQNLSNPVLLAGVYALRGDTTAALGWLEQAAEMGFRDYRWLSVDPVFEAVKSTSGFARIVSDLQTRVAVMRRRAKEAKP